VGTVNFVCNRSGHVDCVVGELLLYWVGKLGIHQFETCYIIGEKDV